MSLPSALLLPLTVATALVVTLVPDPPVAPVPPASPTSGAPGRHRSLIPIGSPAGARPAIPGTDRLPEGGSAAGPHRSTRWSWPLAPRPPVLRPYLAPDTRYGPGHRGVDLLGPAGAPVLAVADGTVTHVGVVAGRGTVTVLHPSGIRSTYEPLTSGLRRGATVRRGQAIGRLMTASGHCVPRTCLHLGAVVEESYLDPLTLLGAGRVRLLPLGQAPDG